MRVLQINANFGFGSTGLIVKDIADQIEKEGGRLFAHIKKPMRLLIMVIRLVISLIGNFTPFFSVFSVDRGIILTFPPKVF